ncbi:MAG: hypothetical protein ACOCPT_04645 [Halanaeroarchaeum sp.]
MADDKRGREKQARDADRRQRERDVDAAIERGDEPEPTVDPAVLGELESALDTVAFPATGAEVVAAVGDREVESDDETFTVDELLPETDAETFDTPAAVRVRVQRPTVAAAMKRVVDAIDALPNASLGTSQRDAYEKTFRELAAIDADDDDEGIRVVADWIVERIGDDEKLPGSRAVRRRAATFCRENGYEIRNGEWLGI